MKKQACEVFVFDFTNDKFACYKYVCSGRYGFKNPTSFKNSMTLAIVIATNTQGELLHRRNILFRRNWANGKRFLSSVGLSD